LQSGNTIALARALVSWALVRARLYLITKKRIEVELRFLGDGRVVKKSPGYFVGGVPDPKIGDNLTFTMHRERPDEDGMLNPVDGERTVEESFQINVVGNSRGYRELGKLLLALAELDTTQDPDFHQHHDEVVSADGRSHLHVIFRKQDKGKRRSKPRR
jgi:hypothetical protein